MVFLSVRCRDERAKGGKGQSLRWFIFQWSRVLLWQGFSILPSSNLCVKRKEMVCSLVAGEREDTDPCSDGSSNELVFARVPNGATKRKGGMAS